MRAFAALVLTLSLVLAMSAPAFAGDVAAAADEATGQSIAPAAGAGAGPETCGNGGSCCGACQFRQKYAKTQGEGEEGGCPCQRARRAREKAAAEAAAAAAAEAK